MYWYFLQMQGEDDDFGEGYTAESHPLRPTHLMVPLGGRSDSRAPSISSSVSDLDVPIYSRETTIPLSARKVSSHRDTFTEWAESPLLCVRLNIRSSRSVIKHYAN